MKELIIALFIIVITLGLFSFIGFKAGRSYERASLLKPLKDAFVSMYMEGYYDGEKACRVSD